MEWKPDELAQNRELSELIFSSSILQYLCPSLRIISTRETTRTSPRDFLKHILYETLYELNICQATEINGRHYITFELKMCSCRLGTRPVIERNE
jgi:hypothetical protein